MESFSWSDSLRALTEPCLGCLRSSQSERNDLEDLLVDSGSGITADAETLSLHSNPGALRRKRTRFGRTIRLFGWDLFGRPPPIRLPDDDEDEDEDEEDAAYEAGEGPEQGKQQQAGGKKRTSRRPRRPPPSAVISSGTLDSDAAPLDTAAIVSHATKHAEEEAERAARRARRRERREAKRAALTLAMERAAALDPDGEFEGFPGSGGRRPFVRDDSAATTTTTTTTSSAERGYNGDGHEEDEDEEGDFGADAYVRRSVFSSDSGRGSDSLSRTSTSASGQQQQQQQPPSPQAQPYNHHYISQQPAALPAPRRYSNSTSTKNKSSRSSASRKSSLSKRSRSSQSPSVASPIAPQFPDSLGPPASTTPSPAPRQEFEDLPPNGPRLHTAGIERLSSGFPSPGLGLGFPRNGKRDLGAFLANRGDA